MCGIFGIWCYDTHALDISHIQQATSRLTHRGPDDEGYVLINTSTGTVQQCGGSDTTADLGLPPLTAFRDEHNDLAFGFRRLAILDLSPSGHQPMSYANGRYWIVFNGEIYNYLELKHELVQAGYTFQSHTDTEVLLAGYAHWGTQVLTRLVGMFAFAIFDTHRHHLFLARDFFGIKPLYYTWWRGGFAFASEIKALLHLPGVHRRVNPHQLYEYMRYGVTDHGSKRATLFADIEQMPLAHAAELTSPLLHTRTITPTRYWSIDLRQRPVLSFDEAAEQVRALFLDAIRIHLRSDVPVGTALSGGIDSSSIVMAMRHIEGNDLDLHTFSYIADDPRLSEERWARLVGQEAGAVMHTVQPTADELVADLDHLIYVQDEPFSQTTMYAEYRIFRLAQQAGIKVMLNGQGADEFLAGYLFYLVARLTSLLRQMLWQEAGAFLHAIAGRSPKMNLSYLAQAGGLLLPAWAQPVARRLAGRELAPAWMNMAWFDRAGVVPAPLQQSQSREALQEQLCIATMETSLPRLLRYSDRNSMAFSIESRVPFLTPALVTFVLGLPERYIVSPQGTRKHIFRQAMRGLVPDAVLDRMDKVGFNTPDYAWLTTLRPWVEQVLQSERARSIPALHMQAVEHEWQDVLRGKHVGRHYIWWRWVNLIRWAEQYDVDAG